MNIEKYSEKELEVKQDKINEILQKFGETDFESNFVFVGELTSKDTNIHCISIIGKKINKQDLLICLARNLGLYEENNTVSGKILNTGTTR